MAQSISFHQAAALAQSGDAEAQYALSSVLHQRGQFDESLHWLRLAAAQKFTQAQLTLGTLLMDGRQCPRDLAQAADLLQPLAATEVRANLLLSELHGFAALGVNDRLAGLRYLLAAARMGDAGALRQLALLGACHRRFDLAESQQIDWNSLERSLPQLAADIPLPQPEPLHEAPLVRKFSNVFDSRVLDAVIHRAAPLVQRSQIVDAQTGVVRPDPMRTSSHITFGPRQHDHVFEAIERCTARVTGLPVLNGEFLQVLRYRIGEEFRPHVDYFNEGGTGIYQSLADGGQRAQTVLTYLNDDYTGGSTRFLQLGLDIKGHRGDVLHFHNVRADGVGDKNSLHAGMPVIAGEKWLLSQWIRSESYKPRVAW